MVSTKDMFRKIVYLIGFSVVVWGAYYVLSNNAEYLLSGLIQKDVFEQSDVYNNLQTGLIQIYVSIFIYIIVHHGRPLFKRPILILDSEVKCQESREKLFFGLVERVGTDKSKVGWDWFDRVFYGGVVLLYGYMLVQSFAYWSIATALYLLLAMIPLLFIGLANYLFKDTYLYLFKDYMQQKGTIFYAVDISEVTLMPEGDGTLAAVDYKHLSMPYQILVPVEFQKQVFELFKTYEVCDKRPLTPFEEVPDLIVK